MLDTFPDYNIELDKYEEKSVLEAKNEILRLKDMGLLFTAPHEFPSSSEEIFVSSVKALCLHISHDCNLRCRYCFAKTGGFGRQRSYMSPEIAKKSMEFLAEYSGGRRNLEVDFFGGEPLLNFDSVKEAIKRAKEIEKDKDKHFRFSLTTNAILLTDEILDFLNSNNVSLILSLDGPREINDFMRIYPDGTGSYDDTVSRILKAVSSRDGQNYYVRGTYTGKSLNFSKTVLHLADLGLKNISIEPVVSKDKEYSLRKEDIPLIEHEYEILAEEYIKRIKEKNPFNFFHFNLEIFKGPCLSRRLKGCGAACDYMTVTPEGELYPCHQLVSYENFKLGDIDNGISREDIRKEFHKTTIFEKKDCPQCWAKFFCSGGCYANAYTINDDIKIPDKIGCALQKKRIECALAIQAILSREKIDWKQDFFTGEK